MPVTPAPSGAEPPSPTSATLATDAPVSAEVRSKVEASLVDDAVAFLRTRGVLAHDQFGDVKLAQLRDPALAPEQQQARYVDAQKRLLRLHAAVSPREGRAGEPSAASPPDGAHHYSKAEFPGYGTIGLLDVGRDVLTQRLQKSNLCYMHACVIVQYYAIWHTRLRADPSATCDHGVLDAACYMGRYFSAEQLEQHVFENKGGSSRGFLKKILQPNSIVTASGEAEINASLLSHGPGLVSGFEVHSDFQEQCVHHHHGAPSGSHIGAHAMVLVAARTDDSGQQFYLLQNW